MGQIGDPRAQRARESTSRDRQMVASSAEDVVNEILAGLLSRFPMSMVAAIDESAMQVPVPDSLSIADDRKLDSPFDAVLFADRSVIVNLYGQARVNGAATGTVHLAHAGGRAATAYVLDMHISLGVFVVVFIDHVEDESDVVSDWGLPRLPPRLARAHKDGSAEYISIDSGLTEILGWSSDELVGRRALEIVHPDDRETAVANWMEMLETPGQGRRVRLRHEHRDGRWIWLEISNHNRLDDPAHEDVVADMLDISEEMAAHDAVQEREQLLHELAQTVPLGLFHSDREGRILFANERLSDILGVERMATTADLVDAIEPGERPSVEEAILRTLDGRGGADLELRIGSSDGVRYGALRLRAPEHATSSFSGFIGCLEDVTDAVMMRRRLEVQATFDPLTECRNRSSTLAAMDTMIKELNRQSIVGLAVMYVDLDQFKPINDAYGHAAGDQVLMVVAERLNRGVRAGDIVGRIGGDEFVVICPEVGSPAHALRIGRTISERLCGTVKVADGEVWVTASVGVAWTDDSDLDADVLIDAADAAMYASKRDGKCQPVLAETLSMSAKANRLNASGISSRSAALPSADSSSASVIV